MNCPFPACWIEPDGDTAITKNRNAGGGAPTQRAPMSTEEAVKLYRAERERRAA